VIKEKGEVFALLFLLSQKIRVRTMPSSLDCSEGPKDSLGESLCDSSGDEFLISSVKKCVSDRLTHPGSDGLRTFPSVRPCVFAAM